MPVYKPKGRKHWHYSVQAHGVRLRGSTRCTARADALKVEQKKLADLAAGRIGPNAPQQSMTAQQAFARYWAEKARGRPGEADTLRQLDTLLRHFGAGAALPELADPDRISDFIATRRGQFKRVGPKAAISDRLISDATVNREVQLLRRVLRRAQTVWRRDTGSLPDWGQLILPEPKERVRELSAAEEAALFAALRADFHPMVRFALTTGLRLAAVIRLTWRQLDWDSAQLRVILKGGREHVLPMTPALRALLQGLKGQHPIFVFTYVCRKAGGGRDKVRRLKGERYPFSPNGWRKPWGKALAAAGIADYRFHDNRHTAATRLLRRTGNLKMAQRLLGHASIASTVRYAHVTTEDLAQAMEAQEARSPVRATGTDNRPAGPAEVEREEKKGNG